MSLGGANAVLGGYLGSYTGVLLASTAVPLWARSRMFLGPIFVTTAVATGAAATRLVLVAAGLPDTHRTRHALGRVETGAIAIELAMSSYNEYRLGEVGERARARPRRAALPCRQVERARRSRAARRPPAVRHEDPSRRERAVSRGRPRFPLRVGCRRAQLGDG